MNNDVVAEVVARIEAAEAIKVAEQERIDAVRALGFVPEAVGSDIIAAPARGPIKVFKTVAAYPKGEFEFEYKPAGHKGRKTMRCADNFDVMAAKAARHKKKPPFGSDLVAMARHYRDLVERHANAGLRCSSMESLGGGGSGGEFIDAVLRDREEIDRLRRRVGVGMALEVKKKVGDRADYRIPITDRDLVDAICLSEMTFTDVLRQWQWVIGKKSAQSKHIKALQGSLRKSLHRMRGPMRGGSGPVMHFSTKNLPEGAYVDHRGCLRFSKKVVDA